MAISSLAIISSAKTSIKLNKTSISITYGKTYTLKVSGTKSKITWSTSSKSIATVSSKGVVKAVKPGSATISAKVSGKTLKCKVKVKDAASSASALLKSATGGTFIKGVNTAKASFKLKGSSYNVTASIINSDNKAVYTKKYTKVSKNTEKSFVWDGKNSKGKYVSAGAYRLRVTAGEKNSYSGYLSFKTVNDFAAGDGSKSNPYQIKTTSQFKKIAKYPKAYFKQMANLDFNYNVAGGFFSESQPFNGQYDGNKKTISNISSSVPLFNCLGEKGVIKNVIMKKCVVTATSQKTAALVCYNYGKISNCNINANVAITGANAGIVACENYGKISDCNVSGKVSVACQNVSRAGAICKYNSATGKIVSCVTNSDVSAGSTAILSNDAAGGLVADNEGLIAECEAKGSVSSWDKASLVAHNTGSIINCVYTGSQQVDAVLKNSGLIS